MQASVTVTLKGQKKREIKNEFKTNSIPEPKERTRKLKWQKEALVLFYKQLKGKTPEKEQITALATKLNLTEQQIYKWFWDTKTKARQDNLIALTLGRQISSEKNQQCFLTNKPVIALGGTDGLGEQLTPSQIKQALKVNLISSAQEHQEKEFESLANLLGIDIEKIAQQIIDCESPTGYRQVVKKIRRISHTSQGCSFNTQIFKQAQIGVKEQNNESILKLTPQFSKPPIQIETLILKKSPPNNVDELGKILDSLDNRKSTSPLSLLLSGQKNTVLRQQTSLSNLAMSAKHSVNFDRMLLPQKSIMHQQPTSPTASFGCMRENVSFLLKPPRLKLEGSQNVSQFLLDRHLSTNSETGNYQQSRVKIYQQFIRRRLQLEQDPLELSRSEASIPVEMAQEQQIQKQAIAPLIIMPRLQSIVDEVMQKSD